MHIVCPHCTTSYAIDLATLGAAGRTVRCSRCKEVWLARPEDAVDMAPGRPPWRAPAMPLASDAASEWNTRARQDEASDIRPWSTALRLRPTGRRAASHTAGRGGPGHRRTRDIGPAGRPGTGAVLIRRFAPRAAGRPLIGLPTACAAMGALVLALLIWRVDVVRLMPQTAAFYKMVGLDVNLRGLTFKDVKITSETVDGKPVLVIEGVIIGEARKAVELPRLRFSVRDAQGAEIYAWNAVLEQPVLKPGDKAWFKSRLASPPPEGRNID